MACICVTKMSKYCSISARKNPKLSHLFLLPVQFFKGSETSLGAYLGAHINNYFLFSYVCWVSRYLSSVTTGTKCKVDTIRYHPETRVNAGFFMSGVPV